MKRLCVLSCILWMTSFVMAQNSLISFGLRGGSCFYLTGHPQKPHLGYQGLFDFGFAYLWKGYSCEIGLKTGVSVGYSATIIRKNEDRTFTNTDYLGYDILYHTQGTFEQRNQQVQLEIPLMFAIRANGFVWNIGPKLMFPIWNAYRQEVHNINIDAYYSVTDVHIPNELITGECSNHITNIGKNILPAFNVLVSTEIGYEWNLQKHRIGLMAYYDVAPWSTHKQSDEPLIEVAPISNPAYPPAEVTIHPLSNSFQTLLYMDFGLKFYYGLNILDKTHLGLH